MKMKYKILAIGLAIGILFLIILPKNPSEITNAVVDDYTGNIAFSYRDYSGSVDVLRVDVYTPAGDELFSTSFQTSAAYASLAFSDGVLYIFVGKSTNKTYVYDMDGNGLGEYDFKTDSVADAEEFDGWQASYGKRTYHLGDYSYRCDVPVVFKSTSRRVIVNGDQEVIVYEKP